MTDIAGGALFVVSTPIGNMGDFSFRAVDTLRAVAAILAEDTRHTRHLLDRYEIATPMVAYHEHNEARMTPGLVARIAAGEQLALVTDAGTPLVSDPGARLVRAVAEAGLRVVPVPGASALLAALVAAGLDTARFTFLGFLSRSGKERREAIDLLATLPHTAVIYEAPGRVSDTLIALADRGGGERECVVAREMTKLHEEVRRGTVAELGAYYAQTPPRGEVVLVIGGAPAREVGDDEVRQRVDQLLREGASARDAASQAAAELGVPRRLAYRMAQQAKGESEGDQDDR